MNKQTGSLFPKGLINAFVLILLNFFSDNCPLYLYNLYKPSGQNQINTRSSVLKLKHPWRSTRSGQNTLSYLTRNYQIVLTVSNMVLKNIFSRNWKANNKIFLLIKVTRVASTSISNCCLIFGNVLLVKVFALFLVFLSLWNWFNY